MASLSLTVGHRPDEALHGFLGRTAARNGVDAASFCREMELDVVEAAAPTGIGEEVPEPDRELRPIYFVAIWARMSGGVLDANPFAASKSSTIN